MQEPGFPGLIMQISLSISIRSLYQFNVRYENSSIFHWAVRSEKLDVVRKLLHNSSPNVNTVDVLASIRTKHKIENTPGIQYLVANGEAVLAQSLVERNLYNLDQLTPIMAAVTHEAMFFLLLQRDDVDLLYKDRLGRSILAHAATRGSASCVERLLARRETEINAQDHRGRTPLAMAIRHGQNRQVVRVLLAMDAIEVNRADTLGCTPLHHAIRKSDEITELLLSHPGIDVNQSDHRGRTPLIAATGEKSNLHRLAMLLDHTNILVDQQDNRGRTALWHATCLGHHEAAHLLVQKGSQDIEDL